MARSWGSPEDEINLTEEDARELMCVTGRRLAEKGMADANAGNLSLLLDDERVLVTPTLIAKACMEPGDLVVLDREGKKIEGRRDASSEVRIHLAAFDERPDIRACVHAHPRQVLAWSVLGLDLPSNILTETEQTVGEVGMAPYETPGIPALAEKLRPFYRRHNAVIMAQHGGITLGRGLIEAAWFMETLDTYCHVALQALATGRRMTRIPKKKMEELLEGKQRQGVFDARNS